MAARKTAGQRLAERIAARKVVAKMPRPLRKHGRRQLDGRLKHTGFDGATEEQIAALWAAHAAQK